MNTKSTDRVVQAYLFFGGRCEEALNFYQQALGARVDMLMRFKDCPDPMDCPDAWREKIMHASIRVGETDLMLSDGCWQQKHTGFDGFALSISVPNEAEADRRFAALAEGGEIKMPMDKTFFARRFGMVSDRFGVNWMIIVPAEEQVPSRKLETAVA